jgi:uncharacterized membrane protein
MPPAYSQPPQTQSVYSPPAHWGPFTAGQMLRRTFEIYREHAGLFIGISAVAALLNFAVGVPGQIFSHYMRPHGHDMRAMILLPLLTAAVSLVTLLFSMLIMALAYGAIFLGVHGVRMGSSPSVASALEATSPRIGALFGGMLLVMLRMFGWVMVAVLPFLVLTIGFGVMMGVAGSHGIGGSAAGMNSGALAGVGILFGLLAVVFAIGFMIFIYWTYARYILLAPVIMEEELGPAAAIRRSIELSRGSRGRIYALIAFVILLGIMSAVFILPLVFYGGMQPGAKGLVFILVSQVVAGLFAAFLYTPVAGIGTALCYYDLRARHAAAAVMAPPQNFYREPPMATPIIAATLVTSEQPGDLTYDVPPAIPPAPEAPIPPPPAVGEANTGITPEENKPPGHEEI